MASAPLITEFAGRFGRADAASKRPFNRAQPSAGKVLADIATPDRADGNRFKAARDRLRALLEKMHTARVKIIVGTTDLQLARGNESFQSG